MEEMNLKGWKDYLRQKKDKTKMYIMINASYRLVDVDTVRDRFKIGGTEMIHKITLDEQGDELS